MSRALAETAARNVTEALNSEATLDPVTIDPKVLADLQKQVAEDAALAVIARLRKSAKLPDGYKLDGSDPDSLFKAAGIPSVEEVRQDILNQFKAAETTKLIGDIADSRREKSTNGYPRPPFSFRDFLLAIAAGDPRTSKTGLPKVKTSAADIAKWSHENEKARYDEDTQKALDLSTDAAGGFLVPEFYSDMLLQPRPGAAPCIALGTNLPMDAMRTLHLPRLEDLFNPTVYWQNYIPGTAMTESSYPTFDQPDLALKSYYVNWKVTYDLLRFNNVGLEQLMIGWVASAIQRELDRLMLVGDTGGGDPYDGIINTTDVENVALATPGTLVWQDIRNLRSSVPAQYHSSCRYVMNQLAEAKCMTLEDDDGHPLWNRDMQSARPNMIDGFPYVVDNQIPSNIGGANQTVIGFGDLSYWLQGNGGQSVGMSDQVGWLENVNWYKVLGYGDGFYAIAEALAFLEAVPTT